MSDAATMAAAGSTIGVRASGGRAPRRDEIEDFLYAEASLLDTHQYREWFSLCTDDVVYWVPAGGQAPDPEDQVSLIYDSCVRLDRRIERLAGDWVFSQDPYTQMSRAVTNVQPGLGSSTWVPDAAAGDFPVRCRFEVTELRRHHHVQWVGTAEYRLRANDPAADDPLRRFRISYKKVTLINRNEELPVIAFIL
ncbi:aromatic-ring-hydroxylating dioxygenase subunit beta [Micromonospora inositola]|uniref:3-phenylpropionate/cinnamic acid dioxygenase, small subunit n=1 Tax=Micromonospora inositola TaxID=47865 RepID=A0A1C5K5A4_9ACTN|nr:aromatic-ring-hydroxylating dioxygenase subunit beta [Micromonospora inositola]SCG77954.1 3-phenylpropionate/cinnamic acid dioxygenase, small subunit [Micromonospora inositola]